MSKYAKIFEEYTHNTFQHTIDGEELTIEWEFGDDKESFDDGYYNVSGLDQHGRRWAGAGIIEPGSVDTLADVEYVELEDENPEGDTPEELTTNPMGTEV